MKTKALFDFVFTSIFTYSTVREARIKSWKITALFRLFQLGIIGYIIGWSIVYQRGYQTTDSVSGTVTTKVKGLGYTYQANLSAGDDLNKIINTNLSPRIFDTADYVVPPLEHDSIFIMTNFVETRQAQGVCGEDFEKVNCTCQTDEDCVNLKIVENNWNGIPTGKCVDSEIDPKVKVCQIASWCPLEREKKNDKSNMIENVLNFTIFVKNDIQFKLFNKKERNVPMNITNSYISTCINDKQKDPYCPVFKLGNLLSEAEKDPKERELMLAKGGVIQFEISWQCNYDSSSSCKPVYSFSRYDIPFSRASAASGFNFRHADKYEVNGTMYRTLNKSYGLRILVSVTGQASKFSLIQLLIKLGAGLGLLGVATLVADFILLNLTSKKQLYRDIKRLEYSDNSSDHSEPLKKVSISMRNPTFGE